MKQRSERTKIRERRQTQNAMERGKKNTYIIDTYDFLDGGEKDAEDLFGPFIKIHGRVERGRVLVCSSPSSSIIVVVAES